MNRERALELLRGGSDSVSQWNRWRVAHPGSFDLKLPPAVTAPCPNSKTALPAPSRLATSIPSSWLWMILTWGHTGRGFRTNCIPSWHRGVISWLRVLKSTVNRG